MKKLLFLASLLAIGIALIAQTSTYLVPLWSNSRYAWPALGPHLVVSNNVLDAVPAPFTPQPNQVLLLAAPQSVFTLTCKAADIHVNGLLQSEGATWDYTIDATGLVVTFNTALPAGYGVKITYRC